MPDEIRFYIREDPYGFLSNFWRCEQSLVIRNMLRRFATNEHYYQSCKAKEMMTANWIGNAPTAYLAMITGRKLKPDEMVEDWEAIKVETMLKGLREKFTDTNLRVMLLMTGDAILIEDSPVDMFWGGKLPESKNMLGNLLMQVREEIKHELGDKEKTVL